MINFTNLPYKSYQTELHNIHQLPIPHSQLIGQSELILQHAYPLPIVLCYPSEQRLRHYHEHEGIYEVERIAYLDNDFKAIPLISKEIV